MVACRSCGRNITSGPIRCTSCGTPFHLSCSHRYKISPEGIFNVCCGSNETPFPGNGASFQMRTRRGKRRLQPGNINNRNSNNRNNSVGSNNSPAPPSIPPLIPPESMRYGKIQKTSLEMAVEDKPIVESDANNCAEIIQEDFTENDTVILNEYNNDDDEITILNDDDEPVPNEVQQNQNNSELTLNTLNTNELNNKITLETVWQGITSLQSSITNISNSLDTVSTHLNTFDPRINDLEATLNTIKNKTSNFENVQNDVSGLRTELETIREELENIKSNQPEKGLNLSEVVIEIKEREMKSRNILIYNVPEDNLRISEDYSTLEDINKFNDLVAARDNSRAREILENVPNVDLDDIQTRRLGRPNSNTCRPLRVTLQSRDDVITIMKNKRMINSQYNVKTDLTKFQQKRIKELREELEKTNVNRNNPTMTIKFINGEPQLIQIRRNFMKNE